jgi:hypothetical protein
MNKKNVLLTALAIAGFAVTSLAQTVPNYVPSNGLVGWWPFNGNATDESINTNDGTVNGATLTADRFGNASSAYSFDGVDDFIMTSYLGINGNNQRTISFWGKPLTNTGDNYVFSYGTQAPGMAFGALLNCSNTSNFQTITSDATSNYTNLNFCNNWNFFTIVLPNGSTSQNQIQLYVNGAILVNLSYYNPGTTINTGNSSPFQIGRLFYNLTNNYFKGEIDDIGFWNRALTQNEITGLYNGNLCFQTITVTDTLLINTNLTGFNPVTYQNTIKIWPNPTNDHITIDNGNLANLTGHQIKISNALGQQVFQSAITQQQFYVDMSTWGGNGIYFVNLINSQGVTIETRKIVLQ